MTLTSHAIVGAVLAASLPAHPVLVSSVAFLSHFVLDAIPHWDYPIQSGSSSGRGFEKGKALIFDFGKVAGDAALGFFLTYGLFMSGLFYTEYSFLIFLGAFFSMVPDGLQFLYHVYKSKVLAWIQNIHMTIHSDTKITHPVIGPLLQVIFIVVVCFGARMLSL